KGAKIEARNNEERTPLHKAAKSDAENVVKLLIERGAEVNPRDKYDLTPVRLVENLKTAHILEQHGATE
ncbi:ankyrin repeat domain-containing protein, partial [bacterium]|nr:ankyrin repeat domain-containing protein [bacterium]